MGAVVQLRLLLLLPLLFLAACSDPTGGARQASPAATTSATTTEAVAATPSESQQPLTFLPDEFNDLARYLTNRGLTDITEKEEYAFGKLCDSFDGLKADGPLFRATRNAFIEGASSGTATRKDGARFFELLLAGCVKTGHTTLR